MQFLVSRLASPTTIDFGEDGRSDALCLDDQITSSQPLHYTVLPSNRLQQQQDCVEQSCCSSVPRTTWLVDQPQNCTERPPTCIDRFCHSSVPSVSQPQGYAQKSVSSNMPPVTQHQSECNGMSRYASVSPATQQQDCATQHRASTNRSCQSSAGQQSDCARKSCCAIAPSDSESTLSLNELLDGCHCDTDAGETYAVDSCDVDDCAEPSVGRHCEIVNFLRVSVDTDATHRDTVPQTLENSQPAGLVLSSPPCECVYDDDELTGQNESTVVGSNAMMQPNSVTVTSPLTQHSVAKSCLSSSSSSSDKAHVDDGYHSNATSAASQETGVYDEKSSLSAAVPQVST